MVLATESELYTDKYLTFLNRDPEGVATAVTKLVPDNSPSELPGVIPTLVESMSS